MDNRSAILAAALELFSARGYDGVGVQEVAEAAGITKPTLYHYYGSKLGLLKALLDGPQVEFTDKLREAAGYHGWLPHSLEAVTRVYFDFARRLPDFYRLQLALYFAPRRSEAFEAAAGWNERQHALVEELFALAVKDNGNMRGRQKFYAATFIGTINTCIGLWLNGYLELDEALVQRMTKQFQHGIYS